MKQVRQRLETLLQTSDGDSLRHEFHSKWLNELFPDLFLLAECDQGIAHSEGDVAVHTGLVFDNIVALAPSRLGRPADFIERLAVLLHDYRKPQTRSPQNGGTVSFPGHEELAAAEISSIAEKLDLTEVEYDRLYFLVAKHGKAHRWNDLTPEQQIELSTSPWNESMALLQEADARSCISKDGGHLPIFWSNLMGDTHHNKT